MSEARRASNNRTASTTATTVVTAVSEMDIRKIENATEGLASQCFNNLKKLLLLNREAAITICDYINSMRHETNVSNRYRKDVIMLLCRFSIFSGNSTVFKQIMRENVLSFLDSFRKIESVDPMHKWIGTYNIFRIHLMRFFRWLYYPDIYPSRSRPIPSVIENIPQLKRKEVSCYKPTDLWSEEDDKLFLTYCPSARDRCYHTMSRDSACRPHELLKLRIKDIVFKLTPNKKQYAEVLVNGKTGSRSIPLINCIPFVKDWISQHPNSGNPNSILLCGFGRSLGRAINERSLGENYRYYKVDYFPKLLDNPNVPPEDKQKIRELLKKPWNLYIRRHTALTEKSGILKEHYLRQYAGWSPRSNMHLKYIHYYGNESSESLLEASGIITKDKQLSDILKPKSCPNCSEPNKYDSKFCAKCRMVLTYDAYSETLEDQKELQNIKKWMEGLGPQLDRIEQLQKEVGELRAKVGK
jgi:integrase